MRVAPAALLAALAFAPVASAEPEAASGPVGAHGDAVELGVGAGWVAGFGNLANQSAPHVRAGGMGAALELDAGWRPAPSLVLGVWGFGAQLSETAAVPSPAAQYLAGAGAEGTWHFRPAATDVDPWLALGAGWRAQWLAFISGPAIAQHGVEMLRARAGLDVRVSPSVAISPVLGVSLSTFLLETVDGRTWQGVPVTTVDTFVFAGARATVDLPLAKRREPVAARRGTAWPDLR